MDEQGPGACAVWFAVEENLMLYFLSSPATRHGAALINGGQIAFTVQQDDSGLARDTGNTRPGLVLAGDRGGTAPGLERLFQPVSVRAAPVPGCADGADADDVVAVAPAWLRLIDNTRGFGFKQELELAPEMMPNESEGLLLAGAAVALMAASSSLPSQSAAHRPPDSANAARRVAFELGGHVSSMDYLSQMRDIGMAWVKIQASPDTTPDLSATIKAVHGAGMKLLIGAVGDRNRASETEYHKQFARQIAAWASKAQTPSKSGTSPTWTASTATAKSIQPTTSRCCARLTAPSKSPTGARSSSAPATRRPATLAAGARPTAATTATSSSRWARWRRKYMDCIGAHHNGSMVGPDQTSGAPMATITRGISGVLLTSRTTHFGGRVPICWTELGYVTGEGLAHYRPALEWGSSTTLDNQAQWLARAAQLSRESGKVRLMVVWNVDFRKWDADPQAGYSIIRPNGECRACNAIKAAMGR